MTESNTPASVPESKAEEAAGRLAVPDERTRRDILRLWADVIRMAEPPASKSKRERVR